MTCRKSNTHSIESTALLCVSQTKFPVKEFEDLKQTNARLSPELRPDPVQYTYQAFFMIHFHSDLSTKYTNLSHSKIFLAKFLYTFIFPPPKL
jgi:hypothetical protein